MNSKWIREKRKIRSEFAKKQNELEVNSWIESETNGDFIANWIQMELLVNLQRREGIQNEFAKQNQEFEIDSRRREGIQSKFMKS